MKHYWSYIGIFDLNSQLNLNFAMRHLLLLAFLIIAGHAAFGQEYRFLPSWEVGTKKTIQIVTQVTESIDGQETSSEIQSEEIKVKVIGHGNDYYVLEFYIENLVYSNAIELYKRHKKNSRIIDELKLIYRVDKNDGSFTLKNWEGLRDQVNRSLRAIFSDVSFKNNEQYDATYLVLSSLEELVNDKKEIESLLFKNIDYLAVPFEQAFTIDEPVIGEEFKTLNHFNSEFKVTQSTTLIQADAKDTKFILQQNHTFELDDTVNSMKKNLMTSFENSSPSEQERMNRQKEVEKITMEASSERIIDFNAKDAWVQKVSTTNELNLFNPLTGDEKHVTKTIITVK